MQALTLESILQIHKRILVPDVTFPVALVINSLPRLPTLLPLVCHLDKTLCGAYLKACHPQALIEAYAPGLSFSGALCLDLQALSLEAG